MLELRDIQKAYEGQPLLKGVSFQVKSGETVCLLGPSGSGKSTLLRLIAGLDQPDAGKLLWDGQDLSGIPVHRRQFGLMFQDYALFPHQTVSENVAFGLRMRGVAASERLTRVTEALKQVNLEAFARRRVTDLSGGEQQRVALARALAPRPRLLMLDEPLGALDRTLREQLLQELRELLHHTGIPAIYVTHDQEEAYAIADRLVLLHDGQVEQDGSPSQVYLRPANPWVARFMGMNNLLEGKVCQPDPLQVQTELGTFSVSMSPGVEPSLGQDVTLLLRSNEARTEPPGSPLPGRIVDCTFRGEGYRVEIECANGAHFTFGLNRAYAAGESIQLWLPQQAVTCLIG
jgi:spermidine/putrescine transport system ATP-binding protein